MKHRTLGFLFRLLPSMRLRMTVAFTLAVSILLSVGCYSLSSYSRGAVRRQNQAIMQNVYDGIINDIKVGELACNTQKDFAAMVADKRLTLDTNKLALVTVAADGTLVHGYPVSTTVWPPNQQAWQYLSGPIPPSPPSRPNVKRDRAVTVVVAKEWGQAREQLDESALGLAAFCALITFACGAGAWVLVGHTLAPIGLIARQAEASSTDILSVRLEPPSGDREVVELVNTLNEFLGRLAATTRAKSRFYTAASHELRTPLQALSGHLEVALSRPRSETEYRAALAEAQIQTQSLTSLIQALLVLNQVEMATVRPVEESVNLADLMDRAFGRLAPQIESRGLQVDADLPDCEVHVPLPHMEMLVRNLSENAVKYARPGGRVSARVVREPAPPVLKLELFNDCDIAPTEELDRYFEAFFRPDASRNSATGGNGLGLAICKAVANSNGWELEFLHRPGGVALCLAIPENGDGQAE